MYQTQKLTYLFDSLYAVNNICFWHYTKDWELRGYQLSLDQRSPQLLF